MIINHIFMSNLRNINSWHKCPKNRAFDAFCLRMSTKGIAYYKDVSKCSGDLSCKNIYGFYTTSQFLISHVHMSM